jgi:hypothetical protein
VSMFNRLDIIQHRPHHLKEQRRLNFYKPSRVRQPSSLLLCV